MLRATLLFTAVPFGVLALGIATGRADAPRTLAVAFSCPASVPGPDCSRATALDVLSQPAGEVECPKVAQILATHLDLPPGGYHKLACERRKG